MVQRFTVAGSQLVRRDADGGAVSCPLASDSPTLRPPVPDIGDPQKCPAIQAPEIRRSRNLAAGRQWPPGWPAEENLPAKHEC